MTNPEFGAPTVQPPPTHPAVAGPCGPARAEVDLRCAAAERVLAAAQTHQDTLREARHQHFEAAWLRESDNNLRDRRALGEEKDVAQAEYHEAVNRAVDLSSVQAAAAEWTARINRLNQASRMADDRADALAQQVSDLERALPGLEMAADAARIAAEAAQVGCLESRRLLAACEEESQRRGRTAQVADPSVTFATASPIADASPLAEASPVADASPAVETGTFDPAEHGVGAAAARALMRGDRQTLLGLALRLAEETGFEAGRLQLLLIELREQIASRALEDHALTFPSGHPFWSQFPTDTARRIAASLSSMGYRFDGTGGWAAGRVPQIRDLALALSYCGYDPRSLRRPAGQAAIEGLWAGTAVGIEEFLLERAPDLALSQMVTLLGPNSGRLTELWDIWGRLRPLLTRTGSANV